MPRQARPRPERPSNPRLTTAIARLFPFQGHWTEGDYLALPETNHIVELCKGRLVIPDLPSDAHQFVVAEFYCALRGYALPRKAGQVRFAPLRVRLTRATFREPDVVFMQAENERRCGQDFWEGADLVAEILSPRTSTSSGTERTDRHDKLNEYAAAGIRESWIVDPQAKSVEVFVLDGKRYVGAGRWISGQSATSRLLEGFAVEVSSLFPR